MKALIPVAGAGTRLRPHTYTQPKPLIPVAGKPIISFIIDQLRAVNIEEFVLVVGYLGDKIIDFIVQKYPDLNVTFVQQNERKGLGHAVWSAREAIAESSQIFIVLGDTIFDANLLEMLDAPCSTLGVKKVEDPRHFGVAEINEEGFVKRVMEKPKIPKSNMALVGLYNIREVQQLIDALEHNITHDIRTLGEYQLTDGLMRMIDQGVRFQPITVSNWFDCGRKEILIETNAMLLKRNGGIEATSFQTENAIIIPPVSLGENCVIENTIIGPNVSVGDNVTIRSSIVSDSILGNFATLQGVVLHKSVIGSDTVIKGFSQSLNIGDNTEIDLS